MEIQKKRRWPVFLFGTVFGFVLSVCIYVYSIGFINIPFLGTLMIGGNPQETVGLAASSSEALRADLNYGRINLKMHLIQNILEQDYYYDEDAQAVEDGIFTGMMYGLTETDRYAAYYSAEEFAEELNASRGDYYGIGALISQDPDTNAMTVEEVYAKSPAEEAGLLPGDILKAVNREDITYMDLSTVVDDYVKGKEGTYVNLTVDRDGESVELQIMRGRVEMPSVYTTMMPEEVTGSKKTGYIYIRQFEVATVNQFKEAIDQFISEGAEGIVIDLRNNPGGVMDSALSMLDYLLPDNIGAFSASEADASNQGKTLLLYTENKHGRASSFYASDRHETEIPITVLMNGNSASASEIFAGVLKDYRKAKIVGETSYGKGIVQTEFPLPDGSAIKYTSSQYFTPSGYAVHEQGVTPDVPVEASEALQEAGADAKNPDPAVDNQLAAAIMALYQ